VGGIYRNSSGVERYVHDDEHAAAMEAGFRPRDEQAYVGNNGALTTLTPDQVVSAFDQRIAPNLTSAPDEQVAEANRQRNLQTAYGGVGAGAEALGIGALSGATFGVSDLAFDPETIAKYQEAHPGASFVGNLAGSIATAAVTGLSTGAAKLGAALAPGSKVAAGLIAGSAEGAAFGAGQATSSLIIKNEPLTAESVFSEYGSDIFLSAAFGGAGGAVGGALEHVGSKLMGRSAAKLAKTADPEIALAANAAEGGVELGSAKGKVLTQDFVGGLTNATGIADELAAKARTGAVAEIEPTTFVRSFRLTRQWLDDNLETAVARAQAGELSPEATELVKATQRKARRLYAELNGPLDELGRPQVAQRGGTAATEALDETAQRGLAKKLVSYRNLAREFEKAGLGPGAGIGEPLEEVAALERFAANESSAKYAPEVAQHAAEYEAGKAELYDALMVRDGVPKKRQLEVFAEMGPDEAMKVAKSYSRMVQGADGMAKAMGSDFAVQSAQLGEELARVKGALGNIGAKAPESAAGLSAKSAMETMVALGIIEQVKPDIDGPADDILAIWLAAKIGKLGAIGPEGAKVAKAGGIKHWMKTALRGSAWRSAYREGAKVGGNSFIKGAAGAVAGNAATHMIDMVLGNTAGLSRTTGRAVARLEGAVGKLTAGAGKGIRRASPFVPSAYLKSVKFADMEHDKGTSAYEQRAAEIRANVANSYGMQHTVMKNLGELAMTHPGVADKTIAQADRTMKFLAAKLPRDTGSSMRLGKSMWKPSEQDQAKAARYMRAALDPDGELERFANGDLSPEGAETLRVLYPAKFSKFQEYIAANLPKLQDKLSFSEQNRMSVLFQVPVNTLMEPSAVKKSQATFAADATAQPISQPPAGSNPSPLSPAQQFLTR
jgi:hypothetical protein